MLATAGSLWGAWYLNHQYACGKYRMTNGLGLTSDVRLNGIPCALVLEKATTPAEWEQGLSDRKSMPSQNGMLFIFDRSSQQCMWMKDMKFSLDIVWLNDKKKIIRIARDLSPNTYPTSYCAEDTRYVIEVNRGVAAKWKLGQTLDFTE